METYSVETEAFLLVFGSLLDFSPETFQATSSSCALPVFMALDETATTVRYGPFPRQGEVKSNTILAGFDDNDVLCEIGVQGTKAVTGGTETLQRTKWKRTVSLGTISTAIRP